MASDNGPDKHQFSLCIRRKPSFWSVCQAPDIKALPDRKKIGSVLVPIVSHNLEMKMKADLEHQNNLFLSIDGWSDVSHTSIHGVLLLKNDGKRYYIGNLALNVIWLRIWKTLIKKQGVSEKVKAFVTDSPATMVKFRNEFCYDHKHIVSLRCCLHAFNLNAKDILKTRSARKQ